MKKHVVALALGVWTMLGGLQNVSAYSGISAGAGVVIGSEIERPGVQAHGLMDFSDVVPRLRATVDVDVFWPREARNQSLFMMDGNLNAQYAFFERAPWEAYGLAGLNLAYLRADIDNGFSKWTDWELGVNLGAGGTYDLNFAKAYVEAKYVVSDIDQLVLTSGLRFSIVGT